MTVASRGAPTLSSVRFDFREADHVAGSFNESESFILPLQRTLYPTRIPRQHHQLKNFISTSDPETIYHASSNKIFALHKLSRKLELIATLQWSPQCLDAAHGWICVGGPENGLCAFLHVGDDMTSSSATVPDRSRNEVDALLPLDLDPESRLLDQQSYFNHVRPTRTSRRKPEVHYHNLGTSIVNSVTIYRLASGQPGCRDETAAILTNNDQTVRIYSLTQSRVLASLQFPTPMNHATISPDQELLLAVGDEPRAFFCRRVCLTSPGAAGQASFASYEWLQIAEPSLSLADPKDCYFTTAWSPSGHLCAVASQTGVITVFDTSGIREDMDADEAVIEILRSSRPVSGHDLCGAVRSMSFAPAPWDLLAWAEDQGRVCITDLRTAFKTRQILDLDPDSPSLNRAIMSEMEGSPSTAEDRQMQIEARFLQQREALDAHDSPAAVNRTADYLELAAQRTAQRRRHLNEGTDLLSEQFDELTERERQTLEAIGSNRLHQNDRSSIGSSLPVLYNSDYSRSAGTGPPLQSEVNTTVNSPPGASSNVSQNYRQMESIREYIRQRSLEHNLERHRTGTRSYQPRRRSSVVISNNNSNHQSSSHPSNLAPVGPAITALSASPSRLTSSTSNSNSNNIAPPTVTSTNADPWQTISDAITPTSTTPAETTRFRREYEEARTRVLERQAFQQRPPEASSRYDRLLRASSGQGRLTASRYDYLSPQTLDSVRALMRDGVLDDEAMARIEASADLASARPTWRSRSELDGGVGTMGIGWSPDGRNMYVGTEDGILEYTVNLENRKTFPGMDLQ